MASAAAEPKFLTTRRAQAQELLQTLELPQFKGRPGWEFTDLSALDLSSYGPVKGGNGGKPSEARPLFAPEHALELAQVDGRKRYGPQDQLPDGVIVSSLEQAAREHPELVEPHLGAIVGAQQDLFVARNEAGFRGGAFVFVPRGVAIERPIVLSAIQSAPHTELDRRTLIVLEEGAQAEIWEQHLSSSPELESLLNTVIELAVGDGARLRFICGQQLSERSWIFGTHRAEVGRDAMLDWVALGFGSAAGRVRMETRLGGPGAEARVTGGYAARGRQHIDFDTTQEHAAPNTTSDLAFRGVLQGRATAVWKGNIIVDPGAQKTDAFQESRNLLLSKRAHADAIPGLEIQANDVRCTHAAAVAQVDSEQLFYLRSHGLPEQVAKRLVIEGFLAALVERFEQGAVRQVLAGTLERRLSQILGE
ncbi:MAG: Fe-S cluster assembly protein SufD [Solirubrobacterales bacterium]|nr:Fe-S cluster assembly protein SufD [Solirubrobacterales bacterium]